MIPEKIVDFMHGGVLSWVGTRDARLRPALTWAFGVRVSAARDQITTFVQSVWAGAPVVKVPVGCTNGSCDFTGQ